jgi:hypothetical protein
MLHVPPHYGAQIRRAFDETPDPPRRFETTKAIRAQYGQPIFRGFPILGVVALAVTTYVAVSTATASAPSVFVVVVGYLGAFAFLLGPAALGIRYARAIREGKLLVASLTSKSNGKWVMSVPHPCGHFTKTFEAADWAPDLPAGAELLTVVSPSKPKVSLLLGPATSQTASEQAGRLPAS